MCGRTPTLHHHRSVLQVTNFAACIHCRPSSNLLDHKCGLEINQVLLKNIAAVR